MNTNLITHDRYYVILSQSPIQCKQTNSLLYTLCDKFKHNLIRNDDEAMQHAYVVRWFYSKITDLETTYRPPTVTQTFIPRQPKILSQNPTQMPSKFQSICYSGIIVNEQSCNFEIHEQKHDPCASNFLCTFHHLGLELLFGRNCYLGDKRT